MFNFKNKNFSEIKRYYEDDYSEYRHITKNFLLDLLEYCYDIGYDDGNIKGFKEGVKENHDSQYIDGEDDSYQAGLNDGYDEGRSVGYEEGYEEGYERGYEEGYEKGVIP